MASTRAATRNAVTDLIGPAKPLPVGDLASNRCVLQQMILLRLEDPRDNRHIPIKELARKTAELLIENWKKVNHKIVQYPVILSNQQIEARIIRLWGKADKVTSVKKGKVSGKSSKRRKSGEFEVEKKDFIESLDFFFDILNCHCVIKTCIDLKCETKCEKEIHIQCSCPRDMKIPILELMFIYHQREKGDKNLK